MSNPDDPDYYVDPAPPSGHGNAFIGEMNAASSATPGSGNKYLFLSVPGFTEQPLHPNVVTAMGGPLLNAVDANGAKADGFETFSGSAFLMIGSNPNMADWAGGGTLGSAFTNGLTLARLAGDPLALAISENLKVSGGTLSGNMDNPLGPTLGWAPDVDKPYALQQKYTSLTGPTGATFADSYADGTAPVDGNPWTGTTFGTAQDPNFLLGYADDTRWRGAPETDSVGYTAANGLSTNNNLLAPQNTLVGNQQVANVNPNRMAESLKLLTKGGWWDHSDGNHISTTMGDKLEVVQGNYKLVILGRQPAPTPPPVSNTVNVQTYILANPQTLLNQLNTWYTAWATATTPITGGVTPANYNVTGFSDIVTTVQGASDTTGVAYALVQKFAYQMQVWLMTQNSFVTDVSGGHFQEQYPSPTPCIKTIEYSQDNNNEWTLYQDNAQGNLITRLKGRTVDLFEGESRETYIGSGNPKVLYATGGATAASPGTGASDLRLDPMIASYTWAQSVYTQVGSPGKFIGGPASKVNPSTQTANGYGPQPNTVDNGLMPALSTAGGSLVANGDVASKTWANRVATYLGSAGNSINYVYSETHANQVEAQTFAGSITNTNTAGAHTNTTVGINATNVSLVLTTEEFVAGLKFSIQLGASITLKAAADLTVATGSTHVRGNASSFDAGKETVTLTKTGLTGMINNTAAAVMLSTDYHFHLAGNRLDCNETAVTLAASQQAIADFINLGL
jgi:hypothetical protein